MEVENFCRGAAIVPRCSHLEREAGQLETSERLASGRGAVMPEFYFGGRALLFRVREWSGRCVALAILLVTLLVPASAKVPGVARTPAAGWIDWIALPKANPARLRDVQNGYYNLLTDDQVRAVGRYETTFHRQLLQVVDRAGLEDAAQAKVDFDPAIDHFVINRVAIWRDGKLIDHSRDASVEILRREGSLDDNIITGEQTAVVRVADVRVGDIVDMAWSWTTFASVWPNHFFATYTLNWAVPVALTRARVTMPADRPVKIRSDNGAPAPMVTHEGALVTREWRMADADPILAPERSPQWWSPWASVSVSTMADWRSIVAWGRPHFERDLSLPLPFAQQLDAIAAKSPDPAARAIAALRLVQDSIRYTSVSIGQGSFIPRTPAETIANGYGDCKDKSLLLVAALRRLGIEAWPALTDIDEGPGLDQGLPRPDRFDHVIVEARIGGVDHWFDATASHQGGTLKTLAQLPYGFALPLRAGQDRLEAIPDAVPARPTMTEIDTYRRDSGGLTLTVRTDTFGDEADALRSRLARDGVGKTERDYLKYYRDQFPGLLSLNPLSVQDVRDANHVTTIEQYRLPASESGYKKTLGNLEVWASGVRDIFKNAGSAKRSAPIALPYPYNRTQRIVIDAPGFLPALPELESNHGVAFDLDAHASRDGSKLLLDYHLVSKKPLLDGADAPELARQVEALNNSTYATLDLNKIGNLGSEQARWPAPVAALVLVTGVTLIALRARRRASAPRRRADRYQHIAVTFDRFDHRR